MRFGLKGAGLVVALLAILVAASVHAAGKKEITGHLVSLNSRDNSMTVEVEEKGKGKMYLDVKIATDAKWHICLAEKCVETKGTDGYKKVNEYAGFEAYGIPHKSYKVSLEQAENEVTSVHVEVAPGKHKK